MLFRRMWEARGFGISDGEITLESNHKHLARFFGMGYQDAFMVFNQRKIETFYETGHMEKEAAHGLLFFNDRKKVSWIKSKEKSLTAKTEKIMRDFYKLNLNKLSDKELLKKIDFYLEAFKEMYGLYHATQPQCFEKFNAAIRNDLAGKGIDELEVFLELSTPNEASILSQEESDRKRMLIACLKGKKKGPLIRNHLEKYRFIQASEGQEPWTEKVLLEDIRANKKDIATLKNELKQQMDSYKSLKKKQQETIRKNHISVELQEKFSVLRHFSNSRLLIRHNWTTLLHPYIAVAKELLGKRYGLSKNEGMDYLLHEVKDVVLKGKKVPAKIIRERYNFSVVLLRKGKISVLTGKKAKAFYKKHVPIERKVDMVKGMIANKGIGEGIAKVIRFDGNLIEQMKSMKRGQILVVGQTRPILMPAIEKAAAIVADEGGITSHAAVVSREFGIPCIVGTHNATRAFKDGDKVYVDANTGIAKKVK